MTRHSVSAGVAILMLITAVSTAAPLGTAITYQGRLMDNGSPAVGPVNMTFKLFDAATLGNQIGSTLTPPPINLTEGLFTVSLDFGSSDFFSEKRWLEITVEGIPLAPRQELTAAPIALKTRGVDGHSLDSLNGAFPDALFVSPVGRVGVGTVTPRMSLEVRRNDDLYGLPSIGASSSDNIYAYLHAGSSDHALIWNNGSAMRFGTESSPGVGFVEHMRLSNTGNLGIGQNSPGNRLSVAGGLTVDAGGANVGTVANSIRFGGDTHGEAIGSKKTAGGNQNGLDFFTANTTRMSITNAGNVGVGTSAPEVQFQVNSSTYVSQINESTNGVGTWLALKNTSTGGRTWNLISTGNINGEGPGKLLIGSGLVTGNASIVMTVESGGNVGIGTSTPTAKLDVVGTTRTQVIQITGGADIAEPFDVREVSETEPGMVVCIDPLEVGKLKLATKPYDRTVAGVVSGANGVQPGMVLQQLGRQEADGKFPIALSGRVWVYADAAAGGAITAGDLLTTSGTPGHAMKVSDHARANGAILGKAMSSLQSGRGLVLVLIGLQ